MQMAIDEGYSAGLGTTRAPNLGSSASTPIDSSNIGFQLLKKQGWKEGSGLGVSQQGRLEPIETIVKKNKRGLGAEKAKKAIKQSKDKDNEDQEVGGFLVRSTNQTGTTSEPTVVATQKFGLLHVTTEMANKYVQKLPKIKVKGISKKIRKIQDFEKRMQEREFDRDFFRMFWPDNV